MQRTLKLVPFSPDTYPPSQSNCQMCSPDTYPPPLTPILPLSSLDTYPPSLRTKIARTVRHVKVIQKSIKPVLTKQFVMPGFPFSPLPPKRQGQARGCRVDGGTRDHDPGNLAVRPGPDLGQPRAQHHRLFPQGI